jgi:hypothetical protein
MFQSGQLLANAPITELQDTTGQKQTLEDIFRSLAEKSKSQGAP